MSVTKIAELAGVSTMTVSRVINDDPRVRPQTADIVRKVIAKLDYVPPSAKIDGRRRKSRSVSGLHTGRIAVLIPDTDADAMRTTLSGRLLHGIDGPAERRSLQLLLTRLSAPMTLPPCIDRRQIDGVIVRSGDVPWLPAALKGVPSVWIFDGTDPREPVDRVNVDEAAVAQLAAGRLQDDGHKRLAVVNDDPMHLAYRRRTDAFIQSVTSRGNSVDVLELESIETEGLTRQIKELLTRSNGPTGLFLPGTGPVISRVCQAVRSAGFEPGKSIELIGCGHDQAVIEAIHPQPANIDIQPEAIGEAAVDLLLWRLANPKAVCRSTIIQPKLIEP